MDMSREMKQIVEQIIKLKSNKDLVIVNLMLWWSFLELLHSDFVQCELFFLTCLVQTSVKCKWIQVCNLLMSGVSLRELSHLLLWEWHNLPTQCLCPGSCLWMELMAITCKNLKKNTHMRIWPQEQQSYSVAWHTRLSCLTRAKHTPMFSTVQNGGDIISSQRSYTFPGWCGYGISLK